MTDKQTEGLLKIIETHSKAEQERKTIEECLELAEALIHYQDNKVSLSNVIEEIADVRIMCEQLMIIYQCRDEVDKIINHKIERTIARGSM